MIGCSSSIGMYINNDILDYSFTTEMDFEKEKENVFVLV